MRIFSTTRDQSWVEGERARAFPIGEVSDAAFAPHSHPWEGFGGCFNELGWHALSALDEGVRAGVLKSLFGRESGCAFRYNRIPIGANDYSLEWFSCNETDRDFSMEHFSLGRDRRYHLPYLRAAREAAGEPLTLFASPWSPPTWMKSPRAYNHGRFIMEPEYLDAYALYFRRFVEGYAAEGFPIQHVHVQNEPNSDQKFPSCVWSGAQLRDFIRDHIGPHFAAHVPGTRVWLGTLERHLFEENVQAVLLDPDAARYVGGVGVQWAARTMLPRLHATYPDLKIIQTENECHSGSNSWEDAQHTFSILWEYIQGGACAYTYWNMVLPGGGDSTWGWKQNSMITVDLKTGAVTWRPEFYVMKHVAHFVQAGARLLKAEGPWSGQSLAFQNPDRSLAVAVHNPTPVVQTYSLRIAGIDARIQATLPPESINTLVFPHE